MKRRAFTLLELIIVVIIIGILASIAIPRFINTVESSRNAEALVVLKSILDAETVYFMEHGDWAYDSNWTVYHRYLSAGPGDVGPQAGYVEDLQKVADFFQRLGMENPNANPAAKWWYFFGWVNYLARRVDGSYRPPNSICFFGLSKSNKYHGLAIEQAPSGERVRAETYTFLEVPDVGGWYVVE